uniref:Uncharacterized protein n=1 Tax=Panagrolaimus sp. PS1159 TaxID=55785 RepID=A0AC35F8W8_9BILA
MDTGVAVRKRVIRIFRDYIDKVPESPKVPEILSKIVRRVSDEEGVKKLALETLMAYWFTPVSDTKFLLNKVITLVDTVNISLKDAKGDHIETFFISVLKKDDIDRNTISASNQTVDTLVNYVLHLENALAEKGESSEISKEEEIETQKRHQNRLLSSLTSLSMFSKIRPELFVRHIKVFLPHLAKKPETQTELQVLNQETVLSNNMSSIIPDNVRGNLMRCIFSVGLMCRFFDFDRMIDGNSLKEELSSPVKSDSKREIGMYAEAIYSYLLFFSRSIDPEVSKISLSSLGQLCSEYPDFFERLELRNLYLF